MTLWDKLHSEPCPHCTGHPENGIWPYVKLLCRTCFEAAMREEIESSVLAAAERLERPYVGAGAWSPNKENVDMAAAYALRLEAAAIREGKQ